MELLLISADKLKITLNKQDMERLSLRYEDMDYSDESTKKALLYLLEKARTEAGFSPQGAKLFIEAYPSEEGGCVLYFTALRTGGGRLFPAKPALEPVLFAFEDADALIDCACRAHARYSHRIYKSSLYLYKKRYFLLVYPLDYSDRLSIYFLSEFGKKVSENALTSAFVQEHGRLLAGDNALEVLAEAFLRKELPPHAAGP